MQGLLRRDKIATILLLRSIIQNGSAAFHGGVENMRRRGRRRYQGVR
jgi:hypothetical protein